MSNFLRFRDCKSDREIILDADEVAYIEFEWTGKKDFGVYIYLCSIVFKSGYTNSAMVKDDIKRKIEEVLGMTK